MRSKKKVPESLASSENSRSAVDLLPNLRREAKATSLGSKSGGTPDSFLEGNRVYPALQARIHVPRELFPEQILDSPISAK